MTGKIIAVAAIIVVILGAVLFVGLDQLGVVGGQPQANPHIIIGVQATDPVLVAYAMNLATSGYLKAGDDIDITVDGSFPITPSVVATVNSEASQFASAAAPGVIISAHTFYASAVGPLANGTSVPVSSVVATAEPNGVSPLLPYSFSGILSYFTEVNALAHAKGFKSVAYPSSGFLPEGSQAPYGWNYGTIASEVDAMWVEMQGLTTVGGVYSPTQFSNSLNSLVSQVTGAGQSLTKIAIQILPGGGASGVPAVTAAQTLADIKVAETVGISTFYFWTSEQYDSEISSVLGELNRTVSPPPCTVCSSSSGPAGVPLIWIEAGALLVGGALAAWLLPGYYRIVGIPFILLGAAFLYISVGSPI